MSASSRRALAETLACLPRPRKYLRKHRRRVACKCLPLNSEREDVGMSVSSGYRKELVVVTLVAMARPNTLLQTDNKHPHANKEKSTPNGSRSKHRDAGLASRTWGLAGRTQALSSRIQGLGWLHVGCRMAS